GLLQDPCFGHALEEALARGGAPTPGRDGAREGTDPVIAAGDRKQLRRPRSHDGPPRMPTDCQAPRRSSRDQSRRQLSAAGTAQLKAVSGARKVGIWLEAVYNLCVERPSGTPAVLSPIDTQFTQW